MFLFRIAKNEYIRDLSGAGARLYGGRWNHKGSSILYTSETRALATLEYLVHVDFTNLPPGLSTAALKVPDNLSPVEIDHEVLPANWREWPPPGEIPDIGTEWALSGESLLLRVPSAVVDNEFNILINAVHQDIRRITIVNVEDYRFDERLFP